MLIIDVALPVPSSMIMVAHGALFGVAIDTVLSVVGSTGADAASFQNGALMFLLVLSVARVSWFVGRWMEPRLLRAESRRT